MTLNLSTLEPGQAFKFSKNIYVLLEKNAFVSTGAGKYVALRLTGGTGMGRAWMLASFGDGDVEVELYSGEV